MEIAVESSLLEILSAYGTLLTAMPPRAWGWLAGILAVVVALTLGLGLLRRRYAVPPALPRAVHWLGLLATLHWFEFFALARAPAELSHSPLLVTRTLAWWFLLKNLLDGVYADLYRSRLQRRPVNHYVLDLVKFAVLLMLVVGALKSLFRFEWSSLLTSSAILTAVIGFSMQETLGSLVSGFLLQLEKPFALGEWIGVANQKGEVVEISWRYTKIQTIEQNHVLVPNNSIARDTLINYSRPIPLVRAELAVPVWLETPPVKVKAALLEGVATCAFVAPEPRPVVRLDDILNDRMVYGLVYYVRRYEDLRPARDEVLTSVWYSFHSHGLELPYPLTETRARRTSEALDAEEHEAQLAKVPLLAGLTPQQLRLLLQSAHQVSFPEGRVLVREGGRDTTLFLLLAGQVAVRRGQVELARLGAGDIFGEMSLLTGEPRNADVVATSHGQCLVVDRPAFRLLLQQNPLLEANVSAIFHQRSQAATSSPPESQAIYERLLASFRRFFA